MGNAKNFEEDLERRGRTKREKGGRERTPNGVVDPRSIAGFFLSLSGAKRIGTRTTTPTHTNRREEREIRGPQKKAPPKKRKAQKKAVSKRRFLREKNDKNGIKKQNKRL